MANDCAIFTDGGCRGNPGPGGWAFIIEGGAQPIERSGAIFATTNNRMELTAVIEALSCLAGLVDTRLCGRPVLYTDSRYVQEGITNWIERWIANGWRTANKKMVKNQDLWRWLWDLSRGAPIEWRWLQGHAGHAGNERCHLLVHKAICSLSRAPHSPPY